VARSLPRHSSVQIMLNVVHSGERPNARTGFTLSSGQEAWNVQSKAGAVSAPKDSPTTQGAWLGREIVHLAFGCIVVYSAVYATSL